MTSLEKQTHKQTNNKQKTKKRKSKKKDEKQTEKVMCCKIDRVRTGWQMDKILSRVVTTDQETKPPASDPMTSY